MAKESLRWSVSQRFNFIEQRLYWEGRFNKADLVRRFSISAPQATADIAHYRESAPDNLVYDASMKAFVPSPVFAPRFMEPDARQYLSQLLLLADEAIEKSDTWLGMVPGHDAIPRVRRRLNADVLHRVVRAIHAGRALEIGYQSMSSPEPTRRWVAPHALAYDGFRWHARAWCYKHSTFIDLVLARFTDIGEDRIANVDAGMDREWHQVAVMRLAPHPDLSEGQRRVIALDYGMKDGVVEVPIRLSLFYYFERQLCLDLEDLEPARRQVVLLNKKEIQALRGQLSPVES
ncbi:MAG: WYL domain-containing protein [Rhodanobacter sp.]